MLKKIKNKLRRFIKERELGKHYSSKETVAKIDTPVLILMLDGKIFHGGLVDRLKGIVSIKAVANQLGYGFKIYIAPGYFHLDNFLHINPEFYSKKVIYNKKFAKPIFLSDAFFKEKQSLLHLFSNKKISEYHIYCNQDYLKILSDFPDRKSSSVSWGKEFHELFAFDPYFEKFKQGIVGNENSGGLHLRFTSALGDFKDTNSISLQEGEKQQLIDRCSSHLLEVLNRKQYQHYYIFSDSITFLGHAKQLVAAHSFSNITIMDDGIGHVDQNDDEMVLKKTLLDFYLLSSCQEIIQIKGPHMYNSNFSRYAAYLNNIQFTLDSF